MWFLYFCRKNPSDYDLHCLCLAQIIERMFDSSGIQISPRGGEAVTRLYGAITSPLPPLTPLPLCLKHPFLVLKAQAALSSWSVTLPDLIDPGLLDTLRASESP